MIAPGDSILVRRCLEYSVQFWTRWNEKVRDNLGGGRSRKTSQTTLKDLDCNSAEEGIEGRETVPSFKWFHIAKEVGLFISPGSELMDENYKEGRLG